MKPFLKSFVYAFHGLQQMLKGHRNFYIHIFAAALALILSWVLGISGMAFLAVIICIGMVISLEIVNTAIEKLCNLITKENHPEIKAIKDFAAAAVLVASIVAFIVGLIIFLPKFINLF